MTNQLRFFLFLDDRIVTQFLEQVDSGEYGEEQLNRRRHSRGSAEGALRAGPAGIAGGYSRGSTEDSAVVRRPTAASRFARLYEELKAEEAVQSLDVADDDIWNQLQVGEIIESAVTLTVPEIYGMLAAVPDISKLMPVFEQFGSVSAGDDDEKAIDFREIASMKEKLPIVEQTAEIAHQSPLPLQAHLASDDRYTFHLRLKRSPILVGMEELGGEARLLAKVQRKIEKSKPETIQLLMPEIGTPANRARRRAKPKKSDTAQGSAVHLRYPAAIVTPIAIYR